MFVASQSVELETHCIKLTWQVDLAIKRSFMWIIITWSCRFSCEFIFQNFFDFVPTEVLHQKLSHNLKMLTWGQVEILTHHWMHEKLERVLDRCLPDKVFANFSYAWQCWHPSDNYNSLKGIQNSPNHSLSYGLVRIITDVFVLFSTSSFVRAKTL